MSKTTKMSKRLNWARVHKLAYFGLVLNSALCPKVQTWKLKGHHRHLQHVLVVFNGRVIHCEPKLVFAGAKANAWTLYPSTKGKAEEAVKGLGFTRTSIYRPGLLITGRQESRVLESAAQCMAGFLDRGSRASIKTEDLAKAMVFNATQKTIDSAAETIEHAKIMELAKEATPSTASQ